MKQSTSSEGFRPRFRGSLRSLLALLLMMCLASSVGYAANDALEKRASWDRYGDAEMSQMVRSGLDKLGLPPAEITRLTGNFSERLAEKGVDPLDAFTQLARSVSPVTEAVVAESEQSLVRAAASLDPGGERYSAFESLPDTLRMSLRTWLGRGLVRQRMYDEALPILAEVEPSESIDPAAALFFRGACYHALLMKTEALADLTRLLEREDECPRRYTRTAQLMVADIRPLKEDSLDEISRLMTDVTRRLDLGRANQKVKEREQEVIDKLSKLIEQIEQQQQQQQQQSSGGGGGGNGSQGGQSSPMQDSQIAGGSGQGDVDKKNIEQRDGWGNLPPAERQEAMQQIGRDLPTHYREAIEAYFRKLATEGK